MKLTQFALEIKWYKSQRQYDSVENQQEGVCTETGRNREWRYGTVLPKSYAGKTVLEALQYLRQEAEHLDPADRPVNHDVERFLNRLEDGDLSTGSRLGQTMVGYYECNLNGEKIKTKEELEKIVKNSTSKSATIKRPTKRTIKTICIDLVDVCHRILPSETASKIGEDDAVTVEWYSTETEAN